MNTRSVNVFSSLLKTSSDAVFDVTPSSSKMLSLLVTVTSNFKFVRVAALNPIFTGLSTVP